jgi:outer membrane receptor protein involved in Fe transport
MAPFNTRKERGSLRRNSDDHSIQYVYPFAYQISTNIISSLMGGVFMIKKLTVVFILFLATSLMAGVTGKIAGVIVDEQTREPLPGVNVVLEGTLLGASTDADGYYTILNVPPGTYTIQATYIGYNETRVVEVKVSVDLTSRVNINMSETTLELSETITVVSTRPLIRTDEVSTRHFVSSEEIEVQPIDSFQEIAQNQAGVVGSHFRGGRTNEVVIYVDGIPIKDPAATYSGNLGGFTSDVTELSIQEMEVSLGGFGAEYGNVQSGIINLALQEGSSKYSGRARFTSNNFGTSSINTPTEVTAFDYLGTTDSISWEKTNRLIEYIYEVTLNGPDPITSSLLPTMGIKIPGSVTLSLSTEITDQIQGFYRNQNSFEQTYQGKLTYRISPNLKLAYGTIYNKNEWNVFYYPASKYGPAPDYPSHSFYSDTTLYYYVDDPSQYRDQQGMITPFNGRDLKTYYLGGMLDYYTDYQKLNNTNYLVWTHTLGPRTYYEVRFNHFYTNYHYAGIDVEDRDGDGDTEEELEWNPDKPGPHPVAREWEDNYWWVRGDDPGYRDQNSWTYTLKADLVSQLTKNHLLKGGFELNRHRTQVENVSWTLGYGIFRTDIWDENYLDFGAYIQDKLEFAGIIGLIGLRFDYFDPGDIVYPGDYEDPYDLVDEKGNPVFKDPQTAEKTVQISPRIGISHPITSKNVLHFSYGHYFQRPDAYFLYRNHYIKSLTATNNDIGNPGLKPEKTVAYEIGIEHLFTDDLKATVTGYYKDITNLMDYQRFVAASLQGRQLDVFVNADYGNSKGLEFTLSKRPDKFWGGSLNYTFSVAKGRSSNYLGRVGEFDSERRMNILDFDQTHTVNANIVLKTPESFGAEVIGFNPFANWTASIQFAYGSGLPYTGYNSTSVNDKRMPWTSTTDMKLIRHIDIDPVGLDLFIDIFNLFDRDNVSFIGSAQYYEIGSVDNPSIKGDPSVIYRDGITGNFIRHPQSYSTGREIRFGLAVKF